MSAARSVVAAALVGAAALTPAAAAGQAAPAAPAAPRAPGAPGVPAAPASPAARVERLSIALLGIDTRGGVGSLVADLEGALVEILPRGHDRRHLGPLARLLVTTGDGRATSRPASRAASDRRGARSRWRSPPCARPSRAPASRAPTSC
jgi:hypothetical protein